MASIKFITRSTESNLVPVYIRFVDGRKTDIWLPTTYRIFPEYWDNKKQAFKPKILYSGIFTEETKQDIQNKFHELKDYIMLEHSKLTEPITKNWLQTVVNKYYTKDAPKEVPVTENLTQYINRFVDEAKSGVRASTAGNTKKRYAYGSLRVFQGFKLSWEMFTKAKKKQYNFEDINIDVYNDFVKFFYGRGCGANYCGKLIKTLKTIMRFAREEDPPLHNNTVTELKAFKTLSEKTDKIYLTEAELKAMFELDISKFDLTPENTGLRPYEIKSLPLVRDVFLTGCYTAQRYSDYKRIDKSMVKTEKGTKYIVLTQVKTGIEVNIPFRPELEAILSRYDYTLPKTFEQKVNDGIKVIGRLAGITEMVHNEKLRGGMKVKTDDPKYKLICTHTARRSGCTNMYLAEDEASGVRIPIIAIMKISGHQTETEFLKYIRIGNKESALNISKHSYFSGSKLKVS